MAQRDQINSLFNFNMILHWNIFLFFFSARYMTGLKIRLHETWGTGQPYGLGTFNQGCAEPFDICWFLSITEQTNVESRSKIHVVKWSAGNQLFSTPNFLCVFWMDVVHVLFTQITFQDHIQHHNSTISSCHIVWIILLKLVVHLNLANDSECSFI